MVHDPKPKLVLLRGVTEANFGQRFMTTNGPDDPTKSAKGETWYEIIGYAETVQEGQMKLYGRVYDPA